MCLFLAGVSRTTRYTRGEIWDFACLLEFCVAMAPTIHVQGMYMLTALMCMAMLPFSGSSNAGLPCTLKFTPAVNGISDTDDMLLSMVTAGEGGAVEIPRKLTRALTLSVRVPQGLSLKATDLAYSMPKETPVGGGDEDGNDAGTPTLRDAESNKPKQSLAEFMKDMEEQRLKRPLVQDDGGVSIVDMQLRKSDIVRIAELELRHHGGAFEVQDILKAGGDQSEVKNAELGGCCCIGVDGGSLIISMCTITAANGSCVGVTGVCL
jgi:hypothetical protein